MSMTAITEPTGERTLHRTIDWKLSILMGFTQSFTYAEIAGMFPNKSGGAPIYGAAAWMRYGKIFGPLSVWSYWLAWSPVLAIRSGIAAGYILIGFFPADSAVNTWQWTLAHLDFINKGLTLRINAVFFLGAALLLL